MSATKRRTRSHIGPIATTILLLATPLSSAPPQGVPRPPTSSGTVVNVSTEAQLQAAVAAAGPNTTIVLAPGVYALSNTLFLSGVGDVTLRGATSNRDDVVLAGPGMATSNYGALQFGIWTNGPRITIANLTIRDVYDAAIVFDAGALSPHVYNVHLIDNGQQSISANPAGWPGGADNGIIELSVIEYTAAARDIYTTGVDVRAGKNWLIRNNLFRNIVGPAGQLAGPAVVFEGGSSGGVVEANAFVNCQREIAMGLVTSAGHDNSAGIVRNNFISRAAGLYGDAAILVADSPLTQVLHNTVLLNGTFSNAIEYRFAGTTGVVIANNLVSGQIQSRDGATAARSGNYLGATASMFVNAAAGDLHLLGTATEVIDRVAVLPNAFLDWDGDSRPQGSAADAGADEYKPSQRAPHASLTSPVRVASTTSGTADTVTTTPAVGASVSSLGPLPSPWVTQGVGGAVPTGSAAYSSGMFIVNGGGSDIGGTSDQFRFVYQSLSGDGQVVARVLSLTKTSPKAKAGVMIRSTLNGNAANAFVYLAGSKGINFQRRTSAGFNSITTVMTGAAQESAPYWVKLVRAGATVTAYSSADGANWALIGNDTIVMGSSVYAGMAVTSHNTSALATAEFDNVSVTAPSVTAPNQPPSVSLTAPTGGSTYGAPGTIALSASASDADGTIASVSFFAGTQLIGLVAGTPYAISWTGVSAGTYTLTAVATDNAGASTTSPPVAISVSPPPNQPPTAPSGLTATGVSSSQVALGWTASTDDVGVTAYLIERCQGVACTNFVQVATVGGTATTYTDGGLTTSTSYSYRVRAQDGSGSVSAYSNIGTTTTTAPPTVTGTQLTFTPSADNDTNVTYYVVNFLLDATTVVVSSTNIGKPTVVNNLIAVDISQIVQALAPGTYYSTVTAVGPGGSATSDPSNSFVR